MNNSEKMAILCGDFTEEMIRKLNKKINDHAQDQLDKAEEIKELASKNKALKEELNEYKSLYYRLEDDMYNDLVLLVDNLKRLREALQLANDTPDGGINDTIWMPHGNETLFDFIDNLITEQTNKF